MESIRQRQVAELVRRHFSTVLMEEGGFLYGREPLVSVANVMISPDLSFAKIYLSIYNVADKNPIMMVLEENQVKLRQSLAFRLRKHVRRIPEISFFLDDTIDEMYKIEAMFKELRDTNQMGDEEE